MQGGSPVVATVPSQATATSATETQTATNPVQQAHDREQAEAREAANVAARATLEDLRASADLVNKASGNNVVTSDMVMEAFQAGQNPREAMAAWRDSLAEQEPAVPSARVTVQGEGADNYARDVVDAMLYRATSQPGNHRNRHGQVSSGVTRPTISDAAMELTHLPLWAVAAQCLQQAGHRVDMYGNRELIAEQAMQMGDARSRTGFYSSHEDRQLIGAYSAPQTRPGDFPNILSSLANKFLDSIDLDEWTYPEFTAVWPTGFGDFKPHTMVNHGTPEELDEILDSGQFNELKKAEEVLSYIFCRRFGNKWGWTPVLVANDDMGAFAEGMLGLDEAWETTQHRLCLSLITSNPTLLNGEQLFSSHAQGNNDRTSGGAPSDSEWAQMETLYADIKGVGPTTRRVRGMLNTILTPTGVQHQEARRTFLPLNAGGLEGKSADSTSNVGLYRGMVGVIPEPELRVRFRLNSVVRTQQPDEPSHGDHRARLLQWFRPRGRRERWYDPETKPRGFHRRTHRRRNQELALRRPQQGRRVSVHVRRLIASFSFDLQTIQEIQSYVSKNSKILLRLSRPPWSTGRGKRSGNAVC